jgi:phosphoglucomutase
MVMTEQERKLIYQKAEEYVQHEDELLFRKEVADALDEHADDDLYDRFYTALAFGTAGMRGVIGGGTNRINPYMVKKVTQGLADYLLSQTAHPSVVIAFDSRNFSQLFAQQAALTLCANNIHVYLFSELHPVPMLSFALRKLHATSGIVITASHNPAKYNGYKVYWSDGGQVTPPHDEGMAARVAAVDAGSIRTMSLAEAKGAKLLEMVPPSIDDEYYAMVVASLSRPDVLASSKTTVAYTPLHGSGNVPVRTILGKLGVHCEVVQEQEQPDGDFPTVSMPNPEDPQAMRLAVQLGIEKKADIVLGTDPDADRLGIAIPADDAKTSYALLTGNQIAVLLCDYVLHTWKDKTRRKGKQPVIVKSIVTTDLIRHMAEDHGAQCIDVLTGFKYIAEQMQRLETDAEQFFLFGCEESFGYLSHANVRDKDAVSSAVLAVEMMSYYAEHDKSLQERLQEIYRKYGYYTEKVLSFTYEGSSGKQKMRAIMERFRALGEQEQFAGYTITRKDDLLDSQAIGLPAADVVILTFSTGEKMVIRPSGTEPKIKYYLFFSTPDAQREQFEKNLQYRVAAIKSAL